MKLWDGGEASTQAFESGVQVAVDRDQRVILARHEGSGMLKPLGAIGGLLLVAGMALAAVGFFVMSDRPVVLYAGGGVAALGVVLLFARTMMAGRLSNALHHQTVSQSSVICILDPNAGALQSARGERLAALSAVEVREGARGGRRVLELVWPEGSLVVADGAAPSVAGTLRKYALNR
ncbi:MAG: hypothetical protein CMN30_23995 [Sandaracinus sp.]|nr:hypothetical protein [Sandaracinus sp.]